METWAIMQLVNQYVPPKYQPLFIAVLLAFVGIEQWLASTKRIKANSTLQAITDLCRTIAEKMRGTVKE
jgi:hypothetical protein